MTEEARHLRDLLEISRAIASTTDYDECLRLVVVKACALVDAEACLLLLAEPGKPAALAASVGLPVDAARDLGVILDERFQVSLRERLGLSRDRAIVAVPMIVRGDVRGILAVIARAGPLTTAATEQDEELLSALADQAALALGHRAHLEELERALSALSAERRWLRAVIEHSPTAVLLVEGTTGDRVTANARADELFGRKITETAGVQQYAGQICTPDGTPLAYETTPAQEALRGEVVRRELAIRRADGRLVPVLASACAIPDEEGRALGVVVLYDDITAIKELQRLREEWTSIVAHDLRQPVQSISMRAQLLEREAGEKTPQVHAATEHILKAVRALSRMIGDLLDSSLLEAQRLVLSCKPHDLSSLVSEVAGRSAASMAGHRISLQLAGDLPQVNVDAGRIEQVLSNLLGNAVRYGSSDSPIEVSVQRRADFVEIGVRNRGLPIDPAIAPHLFERFRRGSRGEGLGLGLYISKGIVEAHGGRIWVESTPEGRTTFHFTLPFGAAA